MPDFFRANTSDFQRLARDLKRAAKESEREVDTALLAIGQAHADKAREILDGHSTSITPIRVVPRPRAVEVNAPGSALAWVYQKGNKDNRRGRTFTHPVFGVDRGDMRQPRFKFFKLQRKLTVAGLVKGWSRGLERAGIKVE